MIQATHDENRKFVILNTLPHRSEKQVELIFSLAPLLNDDIKVFSLVERLRDLEVPLVNSAQLKKLLNLNKYTNAFVCLYLVDWLLKQK